MSMLAAQLVIAASMVLPLAAQTPPQAMASHAEAAQAAEKRGDFSTAAHEYEYLTHQLPRSAEMQSNLGVALYFDHQWERAIEVFRRAITLNPNLLAPHLFSGLAWYQLSQPDPAVPELEKAVRLNPSDAIARTWLGYAYVSQSRYQKAAEEFEQVCKLDPQNIDAWYALGQSWLQIGKEKTQELLAVAPNGGRVWQLAGEQFRLQGNQQKALENFEQANVRRPDIAELRTAIVAMGGKPAGDGSVLHSAIQDSAIQQNEDRFYRQAHDAEQKSRAAFERVVSLAPDSYRAHQVLAYALVSQQKYDQAIQEYRLVLRQNPDLPGVHEAIGSSLMRSGKTEEALVEFEAELKIQPHSASANTNAGQALLMMGKDEEADKALRAALSMDRPPSEVYRMLGKVDLHRKEYRSAVNDLTRYVEIKKDDAMAYYLLSRAYRGLGEKEQMNRALSQFEKVSQDVKARSQAQGELERLGNPRPIDDDVEKADTSSETR